MYSHSFPNYNHSCLSISSGYIYLQLSRKLGKRRFSLGKADQGNINKAIQIGYQLDALISHKQAKDEAITVDEIKKLIQSVKIPHLTVVAISNLSVIWDRYVKFHLSLKCWTETYIYTHIQTVGNLINSPDCPKDIEKPNEILQHLLNGKRSSKTAKDRFKLIVASVDWASKNNLVDRKYGLKFRDCLSSVNPKAKSHNNNLGDDPENEIDPFTKDEINLILEALKNDTFSRFKGKHSQYYVFVKFLWLTGCRPSEAVALKWENVLKTKIKFCEGEVIASGKRIKKKGTKTKPVRFFPINDTLRELLDSLPKNSEYVFVRPDETPINLHTLNGVWNRLIPQLGIKLRIPYQLRHSMISHHINTGFPVSQMAEIVGNSEKVIRDHYLKIDLSMINLPNV